MLLASTPGVVLVPAPVGAELTEPVIGPPALLTSVVCSVRMARTCHALGRGVGQHSNSHLGITMAAMTHLAAAVPNLIYASDTHYPWNPDDIIKGPMFEIKDGYLDVPTGPGLGVELDLRDLDRPRADEQIARGRVLFRMIVCVHREPPMAFRDG